MNFMKTISAILVALVFLISPKMVSAQKISYTVVEDDPTDLPRLRIMISPLFLSLNMIEEGAMGYGLGANYEINEKMKVNFQFHSAYSVKTSYGYNKRASNSNDPDGFMAPKYFDLGYRYNLTDKTRQQTVGVILNRSSRDSYGKGKKTTTTTTESIWPKGNRRALFVARTGVFYSIDRVEGNANHLASFYGGGSFTTIKNLFLNVVGYGRRGKCVIDDLYFDVLFAPQAVGNGAQTVFGGPIGARFGFERNNFLKTVQASFRSDIGLRPGLGLFWDGHVFFTINTMKR
jgi:hypothetical protein